MKGKYLFAGLVSVSLLVLLAVGTKGIRTPIRAARQKPELNIVSSRPTASASISRTVESAQATPQSRAGARLRAIQSAKRQFEEKSAAAMSINAADTSAAEAAARETQALEQNLIESMKVFTEKLRTDPDFVTEALELLSTETDPQMMQMIAQALAEAAPTLGDKFPSGALLKMAKTDASMPRRQAALIALSGMMTPSAELQAQVAELSRNAPYNVLKMTAVDCMGSWTYRNPDLKPTISETLLETRDATDDKGVRGLVIQTIGNMDVPLTPRTLAAMSDAVVKEGDPHNRALAAVALGSGTGAENRETVLTALETAYNAESNLATRRHIITQITKAARQEAEVYLKRLPTPDPKLAMDINDYVEIVEKTDPANWGAIWEEKEKRDLERGTTTEISEGATESTN